MDPGKRRASGGLSPGFRSGRSTRRAMRRRPSRPRQLPLRAGCPPRRLPVAAVDDAPVRGVLVGGGDQPAVPAAAGARPDRPLGGLRSAHAARPRLRRSPGAGRGRPHRGRIDSIEDMQLLLDGIPLDEVSTSMTINAPGSLLLLLYELVAEEQGVAAERLSGTIQNDILKEYIARGNYIFPPRPCMRLTTDTFRYCTERLPRWNTISISRLPHPRGRLDRRAGAGFHAGQRHRLRRGRASRRGLEVDAFAPPAVVLLQRPQRLLRGGGQVPGGAPAVGGDHARPLRCPRRALADAALPCPDRRARR